MDRNRGLLPILAIQAGMEFYRLQRPLPVTASLIAANSLIYLRPSILHPFIPPIELTWFNPYLIIKYKDLRRFFLSPFYHVSEAHLVYNMLSLLWKGIQLETLMGAPEFASMIAVLIAMSQGIALLLAKSLVFFDYNNAFYYENSVGFSGVLFALKVILNYQSQGYTSLHGLLIPSRFAAWAELFLIQIFVPEVSFLGHVSGILAGFLYLWMTGRWSRRNPLAMLTHCATQALTWPLRALGRLFRFGSHRFTGRRTSSGGGIDVWRCQTCTYDNYGFSCTCSMCGTSRGCDVTFVGGGRELTLEEVRRLRILRFGR